MAAGAIKVYFVGVVTQCEHGDEDVDVVKGQLPVFKILEGTNDGSKNNFNRV